MNSIFTDQEHRILLSAIGRERKICEECDREIGDNTSYATSRLIDTYGMPVKERIVRHCRFKIIYIDDFWKWAEENKSLLDFSKMQPYCFGAEPDWVKVKRENDKKQSWQQVPHNTPY